MLKLCRLVRKTANCSAISILLIVALLLSLASSVSVKPVSAHPGTLIWSIVDTPSPDNNVIVSPSEVNIIAIGYDDSTFYAVDIPNSQLYKSTDGGVTWTIDLVGALTAAGAGLPVWNLVVAPDDVNFLVAITDGGAITPGPKQVFVSKDGGANWKNTNFPVLGAGYISCVDISVVNGANRDLAVGIRDGGGGGKVYVVKYPVIGSNWNPQDATGSPPSTGWTGGDVVAMKFSPAYPSDSSLVVVSSDNTGTFLRVGFRDVNANTTDWGSWVPVELETASPPGTSPKNNEIITADLELPSDFSGSNPSLRRFYVSTDATAAGVQSGVYRVDDTVAYWIKSPTVTPTAGRISSIAYLGTYAEGVLLAGEVTAAPATGMVYIWRASDPTVSTPAWNRSDDYKSPTGGAGGAVSSFANAQLTWSSDGARAYCGTSSADFVNGGTSMVPGSQRWPEALLNSVQFDESAFSVSPYASAHGLLLSSFGEAQDADVGNVWNQLSLIDTQMGQTATSSFLSDVAALEAPQASAEEAPDDYSVLYLASINPDPGGFDSIWRSTSDPLGRTWERVLCRAATNNDVILRVRQPTYEETERSDVIVFADLGTDVVGYSGNEGQVWDVHPLTAVTDLALASDEVMYILNDILVYRYIRQDVGWRQTNKENTQIGSGHTIAVPLKNPGKEGEQPADWVIVGGQGTGSVAWADFSQVVVNFKPPLERWINVPVVGDVQVIADDRFEQNKIIYAASHGFTDTSGKIYRWTMDKSTEWDELEPPNTAFYGLAMRNDVLYGAWRTAEVPEIIADTAGVDRTLFPRDKVPPPPEWDYLTTGLPAPPPGVLFTREPSSLKISSNEHNNLWAIDNNPYDWTNKAGCLWAFTDTIAKVGPWTTSPPSGDSIPVDPVTGRANEVNFKWRSLSYASIYELQVAKDSDFSIRLLANENIIPVDQLAPECYFPAGGLIPVPASGIASWGNLEAGHTYYWRVRARGATTGEIVRSPWSATMHFTVESGLPVVSKYTTLTLFSPPYGARGVSRSPAFSWSPMSKTTKYEFILAKDVALQQVVVKTNVSSTSYAYDDELDFNTSYFWQVRAIEPVVSDPSPIGTFTVMEKPAEPVQEEPSPIPFWVWGVIAVCTALVAVMIAFAMIKPGYIRPRAASVTKLELNVDKPPNPIARIWDAAVLRTRTKTASVTEPELDVGKPKNPIARIWDAIILRIRRWRYLRKRVDVDNDAGDKLE
jgi:hypothetical protein